MGYKVFFAFQMDTEDKYGKGFIQTAIEMAIQKLKIEGLDVSLDFGFKRTPGTPLLIEEMLKKSFNSDMVIVDLTFTSSKNWSTAKKIRFFNKEVRFLEIAEDKRLPNPNVLLETGYAWAKKGTYRTLAVMNEAFGSPAELLVDLKGFRWGITFKLDQTNYDDKKAIRKELSDDLYKAIKDAINSEAQYQIEKLKPLRINRNWQPRDFMALYRPTKLAKAIIRELRKNLENPNSPQRIIGPKNSGKTRLAYELYRKINDEINEHTNLEKILYYDIDGGNLKSIENRLIDLRELNQRKILILDNCPVKIHEKVFDDYIYDSNISLLTIDNSEDGAGATHFLDKDYAESVIEIISNETGNPKNTSFILGYSDGNIRKANFMIGKIPEEEDRFAEDHFLKWKQLLGQELYSEPALELLEELSLFTHIGYLDRFEEQSEIILENTQINSRDELLKIIDQLAEVGIIKLTGSFIILEAFIEELAVKRIERLAEEDINKYLKKIVEYKLSKPFADRLVELTELDITHELIHVLSKDGGLIRQEEFIFSEPGSKILISLSEIEPAIVVEVLNGSILYKSKDELKLVSSD